MKNQVVMVVLYEKDSSKFQKLFPNAIFEDYYCDYRFVHFSLKEKINETEIKSICDKAEIKMFFE